MSLPKLQLLWYFLNKMYLTLTFRYNITESLRDHGYVVAFSLEPSSNCKHQNLFEFLNCMLSAGKSVMMSYFQTGNMKNDA